MSDISLVPAGGLRVELTVGACGDAELRTEQKSCKMLRGTARKSLQSRDTELQGAGFYTAKNSGHAPADKIKQDLSV